MSLQSTNNLIDPKAFEDAVRIGVSAQVLNMPGVRKAMAYEQVAGLQFKTAQLIPSFIMATQYAAGAVNSDDLDADDKATIMQSKRVAIDMLRSMNEMFEDVSRLS